MDIELLKKVPLFSELHEKDLERIASLLVKKAYTKGNVILMEEDIGKTLFIIVQGKVKISRIGEDGKEVILSILGEGEFFGELSILDGMARSATVTSLGDSELLILRREDFLNLLHEYPQIAINLLREIAVRIRKSDAQIKSLSLQDAMGKVGNAIVRLADEIGVVRKGFVEIDELPLQQDLANMAGTSRETISRVIKSLTKKGYLKKEKNKLVILDYEKFRKDFS
jgi:CRP-like cAMP-binding protein